MNREEIEIQLSDYLLGHLDYEQSKRVETLIAGNSDVRAMYEQMQLSLESSVQELEEPFFPEEILKGQVFERLGFRLQDVAVRRSEGAKDTRRTIPWWAWSGWAVAALAVFAAVSIVSEKTETVPTRTGVSPALAVFEIAKGEVRGQAVAGSLRELVYADATDFDGLLRAERYAEQLWQERARRDRSGGNGERAQGFVVIDLHGKQGFLGYFSDSQNWDSEVNGQQHLWFTDSSRTKQFIVGSLPHVREDEGGVFYFSLDTDNGTMGPLEQVTPVIADNSFGGI